MNQPVRPKKHLGQHFLHDHNIARKIAACVLPGVPNILEIGPGTGILTRYILEHQGVKFKAIEVDSQAAAFLKQLFLPANVDIICDDFLKVDLSHLFEEPYQLIGNLPYNISSQIFFKTIENRHQVKAFTAMVQKEVGQRIASKPGNREYGILSVLLQAWFDIEYLFTVSEKVFTPPPKVKSAVIRLVRNETETLPCNEDLFITIVKTAFNQRRKTLRNALGSFHGLKIADPDLLSKRAEQLSVSDFIRLTQLLA